MTHWFVYLVRLFSNILNFFQVKYQEAAELLARKAHVSSEEARLQAEKALEIEAQLERCKYEMSRVSIFYLFLLEKKKTFFFRIECRRKTTLCSTNQ